ncbi:MAG: hypothetical protein FWE87_03345 [Coriobacteriia bacterium]|nr:hypothetical protein [Coriobacteriia bacterium]
MGYFDESDHSVDLEKAQREREMSTSPRKTLPIIVVFLLLALPIPLSMGSWLATIMSIGNLNMTDWSAPGAVLSGIVSFTTYFIAGTYLVTFFASLIYSWRKKKLSWVSFMPLAHVVLFIVMFQLTLWLERR